MSWVPALVVGVLFGGIGTIVLAVAAPRLARVLRARSWPAVPGRVITSRAAQVSVSVPVETKIAARRDALRWVPEVEVEYEAGGRTHRSRRIGLGGPTASTEPHDAAAVTARYPVGTAVTVRHDPARPDDGVLEVAIDPQTLSLAVLALVMLALAIVVPLLLLE
jgi:hypothetical protein